MKDKTLKKLLEKNLKNMELYLEWKKHLVQWQKNKLHENKNLTAT